MPDGRFIRRNLSTTAGAVSSDSDSDDYSTTEIIIAPVIRDESVFEVEKIWAKMYVNGIDFFLVQWVGFPIPTWEPRGNIPWQIRAQFNREMRQVRWHELSTRGRRAARTDGVRTSVRVEGELKNAVGVFFSSGD
jgi:hypothetical protein